MQGLHTTSARCFSLASPRLMSVTRGEGGSGGWREMEQKCRAAISDIIRLPPDRQAGAGGTAPQSHAGELPWEWQCWSTRGWSMVKACKAACSEWGCRRTGFPSGATLGINKGQAQSESNAHKYTSSCRGNGIEHGDTPVIGNQQVIAALLNLPLFLPWISANSSCPVPAATALPAPPAAAPALTPSHSVLCIPALSSSQLRNQFLQLRTEGNQSNQMRTGGGRIHPPHSPLCFIPMSPSALPTAALPALQQLCAPSMASRQAITSQRLWHFLRTPQIAFFTPRCSVPTPIHVICAFA